jgi:uncharacterized protein involved in tolerance to divalent cations
LPLSLIYAPSNSFEKQCTLRLFKPGLNFTLRSLNKQKARINSGFCQEVVCTGQACTSDSSLSTCGRSIYRWQGAVEEVSEVAVVIKTTEDLYPQLEEALAKLHPYDIPEILALPIVAGLPAYLDWIESETKTR